MDDPSSVTGATHALRDVVARFAAVTWDLPEHILASEAWAWDDYAGVRYAHLHTAMSLHGLAALIQAERCRTGTPPTLGQHALVQHQVAFRELESLLVGVTDDLLDAIPAPGEWPLRRILLHMHRAERYFLATILNALDGGPEHDLQRHEIDALLGGPLRSEASDGLVMLWEEFERLHVRAQQDLGGLSDEAVRGLSTMWEVRPLPILFRMQRFGAHLREHTIQVEKSLRLLGREVQEGALLVRQVYRALGEVEGLCIHQSGGYEELCAKVGVELEARYSSLNAALSQVNAFSDALHAGNVPSVTGLLAENPALITTRTVDGLSPLEVAHRSGDAAMVDALKKSAG